MITLKSHFVGKSHVIWDWNGTLLDDAELCVGVMDDVLGRYGLGPIGLEEYRRVFRFPVREYYEDIGFDFSVTPFETVARDFMDLYNARIMKAPLFAGAAALLGEMRAEGIGCSVLSAAREDDLKALLGQHEIAAHFDHIYGLGDHYAHSKLDRGHQLLKTLSEPPHGLELSALILVGDTDHDLDVGASLGIDVLLVGGGHQSDERLSACHHRVARLLSI